MNFDIKTEIGDYYQNEKTYIRSQMNNRDGRDPHFVLKAHIPEFITRINVNKEKASVVAREFNLTDSQYRSLRQHCKAIRYDLVYLFPLNFSFL